MQVCVVLENSQAHVFLYKKSEISMQVFVFNIDAPTILWNHQSWTIFVLESIFSFFLTTKFQRITKVLSFSIGDPRQKIKADFEDKYLRHKVGELYFFSVKYAWHPSCVNPIYMSSL